MKKWANLEQRVDRLERSVGKNQERDDSERFWAAMIGQEEKLYRRMSELLPFAEALQRLWRAQTLGGQEAVDAVVMRRLKEPDLPEFDPSVWPDEVRKLVLKEVEK